MSAPGELARDGAADGVSDSAGAAAVRRAIVLAAGRGRRLGRLTAGAPKTLLALGGGTLLDRQLGQLAARGVREVTVVAGWRHEAVARHLGRRAERAASRVRLVVNDAFATAGSARSLLAAADVLCAGEPLLVLHGDVVADDAWLDALLSAPGSSVAADRTWTRVQGDEVLAFARGGRLAGVGRDGPPRGAEPAGEFVGLARLEASFAAAFAAHLHALVRAEPEADWEVAGLDRFVRDGGASCGVTALAHVFWMNVNDARDLQHAREHLARAAAAS